MSLKKRLYVSTRTRHIAFWAVMASVIWIPFPPEVVIPTIFVLSGSKLLAFTVMVSQSIFYVWYYPTCVRILLFEDREFFRTRWIGRATAKSIKKMRKIAHRTPHEHWMKEFARLTIAFGLALCPGTLTLAIIVPLLLPHPRYFLVCMIGIAIRCASVALIAETITDQAIKLF